MKKLELLRKFNYVQFDLTQCKSIVLNKDAQVTEGARLGALRKYLNLFKEYTETKREVIKAVGFKSANSLDKLQPMERKVVFATLTALESKEFDKE